MSRSIRAGWLGLVLATLVAGGCRTYYVFAPVEVETEEISAPFRVTVRNDLPTPLRIQPAEAAAETEPILVAPDRSAEIGILTVRRLRVGGSRAHQVDDGAFLTGAGASLGRIEMATSTEEDCPFCQPCDVEIDVEHESWFAAAEPGRSNEPPRLEICVDDCSRRRVAFRGGPGTPEC